jgi:hypothetical protein
MLLRKVSVTFNQPIICHDCKTVGQTGYRKLELEYVDSYEIDDAVKRVAQDIGTSFPVGWASYHNLPRDIYRCPNCSK